MNGLKNIISFLLFLFATGNVIAEDCEQFILPKVIKFHPIVRAYYSYLAIATYVRSNEGSLIARLPSPYNALGFSGGFKYDKYIGLQFGFEYASGLKRRTDINNNKYSIFMRPDSWYTDVVGYYPILNIEGLDIEGTVGAIANDFSFFLNNLSNGNHSYTRNINVNIRLGLGLRYLATKHWAVDALFHYVPNHINLRKAGGWINNWTVDVGFGYQV